MTTDALEIDRLRAQLYALTEEPHRVEFISWDGTWGRAIGGSLLFCRGLLYGTSGRIVRVRDGEVVT